MALTLSMLDGALSGEPATLRLDGRDAVIGRSPDADMVLPDDQRHVSSLHLEVIFEEGAYWFIDRSVNGTLLGGQRLLSGRPRLARSGDRIRIGRYLLACSLDDLEQSDPISEPVKEPIASPGSMVLLRHLVRGVIRMLDARSRAKANLGFMATSSASEGDNPLRLIRSADRALEALLAPAAPGMLPGAAAIDEAFLDLQAHEAAMHAAARIAVARSVERLAPASVRAKRTRIGLLATLFPQAGDAALWRIYEREFERAVGASASDFSSVFAREFGREYFEQVASIKEQRRSERVDEV